MTLLLTTIHIACIFAITHAWDLAKEYRGETFFDDWTFFTEADPTHGFVHYVEKEYALNHSYIKHFKNSSVYIGTDYHNIAKDGRDSVRISTNDIFNYGLFIAQVAHVPEGCGTWPSFWALGNNGSNECEWPKCGEIDIIEECNDHIINTVSLHTGEGCDSTAIPMDVVPSGTLKGTNCYTSYPEHLGCSWVLGNNSFGSAFNKVGGGIYALKWTQDDLSIWFWEMKHVPANAQSMDPDTTTWGTPGGYWKFGYWCDSKHVRDLKLIVNLAFCGDWSAKIWYMGCAQATNDSDCLHFVKHNPEYFEKAYWTIDYIRVFNGSDTSDKEGNKNGNKNIIIGVAWIVAIAFVAIALGLWFMWCKSKQPKVEDAKYQMMDKELVEQNILSMN